MNVLVPTSWRSCRYSRQAITPFLHAKQYVVVPLNQTTFFNTSKLLRERQKGYYHTIIIWCRQKNDLYYLSTRWGCQLFLFYFPGQSQRQYHDLAAYKYQQETRASINQRASIAVLVFVRNHNSQRPDGKIPSGLDDRDDVYIRDERLYAALLNISLFKQNKTRQDKAKVS